MRKPSKKVIMVSTQSGNMNVGTRNTPMQEEASSDEQTQEESISEEQKKKIFNDLNGLRETAIATINDQIEKEKAAAEKEKAAIENSKSAVEKAKEEILKYKKDNKPSIKAKLNGYLKPNIDNKIKRQIILCYVLYTHLYDNIPDTNTLALESIKEYFFEEATGTEANATETTKGVERPERSFISFFVASQEIKFIDKNDYRDLTSDDENLLKEIDDIVDNLNYQIRGIPDYGNITIEFFAYAIIQFLLSGILFYVFYRLLKYYHTDNILTNEGQKWYATIQEKIKKIQSLSKTTPLTTAATNTII